MFSPCVFVCLFVSLSRCLSGRFNYEGLVPHKQYFAGTLFGMSSCATPSIFELKRRSNAQNVGNVHGYISGIFNFRYNFR